MAQGQHLVVLIMVFTILLTILSTCNAYPFFNDLPVPERPTKFHSQNDLDRYVNRMKQYYETMAHLRYWRRSIDESNEDYDEILQNLLRQNNNLQYKR